MFWLDSLFNINEDIAPTIEKLSSIDFQCILVNKITSWYKIGVYFPTVVEQKIWTELFKL